jgi:putative transposase
MRLKSNRLSSGITMEQVYQYIGLSRQGFYEQVKRYEAERGMMEKIESLAVNYRRKNDRRAGSRSLYYNLEIGSKFNIGVTRFEQLMSEYMLCLAPLRIKVVTTKSDWQSWNYHNLINGISISNINQVVAGDLTYVFLGPHLFYVFLGPHLFYVFSLLDLYSNRLVGMSISDRMRAKDAMKAYLQWKSLRTPEQIKGCIHHTDGGSQYFSGKYISDMKSNEIQISRAKTCLENGYAEQWNGLLKYHFIPTIKYQNLEKVTKELEKIAYFYNCERKQEQLGWKTPLEYETYVNGLQEKWRPIKQLYKFDDPK